ncbi:MAG: type II methionyl aminopeptidase [Nanoarchaeota archaeon]|nr:type II methionyl aminopeptidase [Nanoarchaeota archaeon]
MDDWQKAGKIAAEAREYAKEICRIGKTYTYVADKVEEFIIKKGAFPAFPMDISVNSIAAHYCPYINDENVLEKGDLVKLDIGAHVNGAVADNACTVEIGTDEHKELILASKDACDAGCEKAIPGAMIKNIGKVIDETIRSHGFVPITNLSGHGLDRWIVHDAPTIPNYDNGNEMKLEEGQHIAIEPFATDGIGSVKEGKPCGVYAFLEKKPVRLDSARKLMSQIEKDYKTLPFTERWLKDVKNIKFLLKLLEQAEVVKQYTVLPEKNGGMVSQYENTVCVGKGVTTKI